MKSPYPSFARFNKPYSQVTQWSDKEMEALGHVIVPVFGVTILKPFASQRIPFTEALLCAKKLEHFHLMAQYQYHTETTIEYMENYLEKLLCHREVFSWCRASKSTSKVLEPFKSSLLWTTRRNGGVIPLGTTFRCLQSIVALRKIRCCLSQKSLNILWMNRISTLWSWISWTTTLTISASLATS